jgi:hypothetical protein
MLIACLRWLGLRPGDFEQAIDLTVVEQLTRLSAQAFHDQSRALLAGDSARLQQRGEPRGIDIGDCGKIDRQDRGDGAQRRRYQLAHRV